MEFVTANETEIPAIGFGTYQLDPLECWKATKTALNVGYRHIDTAMKYENEAVVGRAIESSNVDREDIFLTTKINAYTEDLKHNKILEACKGCLERLGTDYIDLLLLHWWSKKADMEEAFGAMNQLLDEGMVRNIGVSNFSIDQLQRAIQVSEAPIITNQVEYHPYFKQDKMLKFCQEQDILLMAYSPLAEGRIVNNNVLAKIGERYGKSASQVALRWLIQQENIITIARSTKESHLRENLDVFDFELSSSEMNKVAAIEGPLLYRLTREGGLVPQCLGFIAPFVPEFVRTKIPL